jgi:hypothetical protein
MPGTRGGENSRSSDTLNNTAPLITVCNSKSVLLKMDILHVYLSCRASLAIVSLKSAVLDGLTRLTRDATPNFPHLGASHVAQVATI